MDEIEQLAEQLRDGDEEARKAAAIALGKTGNPDAVPHLIRALGDELRSVRRAAHDCMIPFGDPRAIEPLINAAADGRLDFNAVAYSLERKFSVEDAYQRTWTALQASGKPDVIEAARPAYERWQARQG